MMGPLNAVSHNVEFYKSVTTTLNEDLLYYVIIFKCICAFIFYYISTAKIVLSI
jgi:hypothetical protein